MLIACRASNTTKILFEFDFTLDGFHIQRVKSQNKRKQERKCVEDV